MNGRPLPAWFDDAKLGIFIHWTPASVPAYAPIPDAPLDGVDEHGFAEGFKRSPYAEWYQNSLSIEGSPVAEVHAARYGDAPYDDFVREFVAGHAGWQPDAWAELFASAGARYVVLVTKHHDGVLLWPSATPNPHRSGWAAERDLVGELADAVRARGMRFGTYYSGGLDWTFGGLPITDLGSMIGAIPQSEEYLAYADAHWRELIERYEPCVLWNDIGYPAAADLEGLFQRYYDAVPDGVVNNRFDFLRQRSGEVHTDFVTPEYSTKGSPGRKWETCRGIGTSFGFNREESADTYLSAEGIVTMLLDVVARGGNLLLNVGPTGMGRIPWDQASRLRAVGAWLAVNGEALFGTRPWRVPVAEGWRFTAKGDDVYAITPDVPASAEVVVPEVALGEGGTVRLLGHDRDLPWSADPAGGIRVTLPEVPDPQPALALRLGPVLA